MEDQKTWLVDPGEVRRRAAEMCDDARPSIPVAVSESISLEARRLETELGSKSALLDIAHKFHDVAVKERDYYKVKLIGAEDEIRRLRDERDEARSHTSTAAFMRIERERDDARKALFNAVSEVERLRAERDEALAEVERLRSETASALDANGRALDGLSLAAKFSDDDRARAEADVARLRAALEHIARGFGFEGRAGSVDEESARVVDGYYRGYAEGVLEAKAHWGKR